MEAFVFFDMTGSDVVRCYSVYYCFYSVYYCCYSLYH
jgi:hypothetical protein